MIAASVLFLVVVLWLALFGGPPSRPHKQHGMSEFDKYWSNPR